MLANWKDKTIEKLENQIWDEPNYSSHLVQTCHKLRKKQLKKFETEDLRIMIGQNIGLKYLIPMSIERLKENLFASGDYYDGDLLQAILNVDSNFWEDNSSLKNEILKLITNKIDELESHQIKTNKFLLKNNESN